MSDETLAKKQFWKHRTGCLLPLALYVAAATAMYFLTRPAALNGKNRPFAATSGTFVEGQFTR